MRRNPIGFEALDLMLAVVAEPDLSWNWKDREEFDEIVAQGIFDTDTARRVTNEACAVIEDLENHRAPFEEPWPAWRPEPSWAVPRLPRGRDQIHT